MEVLENSDALREQVIYRNLATLEAVDAAVSPGGWPSASATEVGVLETGR